MRLPPFAGVIATLALCVGSGDLECGPHLTGTELRGQQLYTRMCAVCHGSEGQGYAADQAPALSRPRFLESATDEYIRKAIADGRRGTTMSAWSIFRSGPLREVDISAIVAFIRTWQHEPHAALDDSTTSGDAARGGEVFDRECTRCHGPRGVGGPYVHVGGPELLATASNGFLRDAIVDGRPGTAMPSFKRGLGETGIEDVIALLRSWQSTAAAQLPPPSPAKIPLGPVPMHPFGPEPVGFHVHPEMTHADVVKAQLDRGARMGLLDARTPSDYFINHIAGAVSTPFYEPDVFISALPKDAWLICYCACPHAESTQLAMKLVAKGFTKVTVLDEGFNVWLARKYPTRSGMDP
jgi:cytochrome c oxidase cbb3-type subunit 3/ubiquinol-cytochrome c reductase cytochrome c subunit